MAYDIDGIENGWCHDEWHEELQKDQRGHSEWTEDGQEALYPHRIEWADAGNVPSAKKSNEDKRQLELLRKIAAFFQYRIKTDRKKITGVPVKFTGVPVIYDGACIFILACQ